jgi:hypothetical protein
LHHDSYHSLVGELTTLNPQQVNSPLWYYHHNNSEGKLMRGKCLSTPEIIQEGMLKYFEKWQWLSGNKTKGESVIVEVEIA